jgi:hypothetical protein
MTPIRLLPVLLGISLSAAATAPATAQASRDACADLLDHATTHIVNHSRGVQTIRLDNGRCRLDVTLRGDVTYTPDFRGIADFSRGGSFTLEEAAGRGAARRLELADDGRGGTTASYRVGRDARPFDAAAQEWLAERLLLLYRRTGLAAEGRAEWLLRPRGIDALVAEAGLIRSSSGSAEYLKRALTAPGLGDGQVVRLLRSSLPSSSSARRELLMTVADSRALTGQVGEAFLEAVAATSSSSSQRELLQHVLRGGKAPAPVVVAALRTAGRISSSSGQGEVLRSVAGDYRLRDDALLAAYLDVVRGLSSSSWQRESLAAALAQQDLSSAQLARVLRTAGGISSSSARGDLLVQLAQNRRLEGEARAAYVDVATAIASSSQRARALAALERGPVN